MASGVRLGPSLQAHAEIIEQATRRELGRVVSGLRTDLQALTSENDHARQALRSQIAQNRLVCQSESEYTVSVGRARRVAQARAAGQREAEEEEEEENRAAELRTIDRLYRIEATERRLERMQAEREWDLAQMDLARMPVQPADGPTAKIAALRSELDAATVASEQAKEVLLRAHAEKQQIRRQRNEHIARMLEEAVRAATAQPGSEAQSTGRSGTSTPPGIVAEPRAIAAARTGRSPHSSQAYHDSAQPTVSGASDTPNNAVPGLGAQGNILPSQPTSASTGGAHLDGDPHGGMPRKLPADSPLQNSNRLSHVARGITELPSGQNGPASKSERDCAHDGHWFSGQPQERSVAELPSGQNGPASKPERDCAHDGHWFSGQPQELPSKDHAASPKVVGLSADEANTDHRVNQKSMEAEVAHKLLDKANARVTALEEQLKAAQTQLSTEPLNQDLKSQSGEAEASAEASAGEAQGEEQCKSEPLAMAAQDNETCSPGAQKESPLAQPGEMRRDWDGSGPFSYQDFILFYGEDARERWEESTPVVVVAEPAIDTIADSELGAIDAAADGIPATKQDEPSPAELAAATARATEKKRLLKTLKQCKDVPMSDIKAARTLEEVRALYARYPLYKFYPEVARWFTNEELEDCVKEQLSSISGVEMEIIALRKSKVREPFSKDAIAYGVQVDGAKKRSKELAGKVTLMETILAAWRETDKHILVSYLGPHFNDELAHQTRQLDSSPATFGRLSSMRESQSMPCAVCGAAGRGRCARCRAVQYCSREHQMLDWQAHKPHCRASR